MYRLFTLTEATRLLPVVDEHLGALQAAASDVSALRGRLATLKPNTVEAGAALAEISFLLGVMHSSKAELDRLGVHVRDVEEGLVDFPSQLGAEVVCLTWAKGQSSITRYHPLSGDTQTRPLPGAATEGTEAESPA